MKNSTFIFLGLGIVAFFLLSRKSSSAAVSDPLSALTVPLANTLNQSNATADAWGNTIAQQNNVSTNPNLFQF